MPQPAAQKQHSRTLNPKLEKHLAAYMTAAAAGAGLLASAQPADASIVYTPANTNIAFPSSLAVDLNHDGITDFNINFYEGDKSAILAVSAVAGNAIRINGSGYPAAGFFGVPVGPGGKFNSQSGVNQLMGFAGSYGGSQFSGGVWLNVTNRYLGIKFQIAGQTHYGWARLSSNICCGSVVLTGYAYETTPNMKIIDGHVSGPSKVSSNLAPANLLAPAAQPASLGLLARGAEALYVWRREEESIG